MERVLVTGGGGFIGKALTRALVDRGLQVAVVGRNSYPDLDGLGVDCLRGDIRDAAFLRRACAGRDTIFHVAARAGVWGPRQEYFSTNLGGTENVIAACRANGVGRLVYTSTPSVVFDRGDLVGADEHTPYARSPLCAYAASKIEAERVVLQADARGHFISQGRINGKAMQYMVDTGASAVAIGQNDADRMGIRYRSGQPVQMQTANGVAQGWRLRLDSVHIGDVELRGVDAIVTQQPMPMVLLGNSVLTQFNMTRSGNEMVLEKR